MIQDRLSSSVGTARILGAGAIFVGIAGVCCCGLMSQRWIGAVIPLAAGVVPGVAWLFFAAALDDRRHWAAIALMCMMGLVAMGSGYVGGYCVYGMLRVGRALDGSAASVLSLVAVVFLAICLFSVLEFRNLWRVASHLRTLNIPEAGRGFTPILPVLQAESTERGHDVARRTDEGDESTRA